MPLLRAFIVEDSPLIRENLISTLEELVPMSVVGWADNEGDAVRWLADKGGDCDLAIVDLFLRGGSGTGILRTLKERESTRECVVLTNYATPDIVRRCLQLGAARVFDKSRDIDALIEHCLARHAATVR